MPEMRNNEFIKYLYQSNREEEDVNERATPRNYISESKPPMRTSIEHTMLSLVDMPTHRDMLTCTLRREHR